MEDAKVAVAREAEKATRMEASLTLNEEKCQTLTSLNEHLQQQITLVIS
jgi:pantothenate kinase